MIDPTQFRSKPAQIKTKLVIQIIPIEIKWTEVKENSAHDLDLQNSLFEPKKKKHLDPMGPTSRAHTRENDITDIISVSHSRRNHFL